MESNYTQGLVHYWPVLNDGSLATIVQDLFTGLELRSERPSRCRDRHGELDNAIDMSGEERTTWSLPATAYFNNGAFTFMVWLKIHTCTQLIPVLSCNHDGDVRLAVYLTCEKLCVSVGSNITHIANVSLTQEWTHLAVGVSDEGLVFVYVNGAAQMSIKGSGERELPQRGDSNRERCWLGRLADQYFANAAFDEIKLFNRSLSGAEIENDYKNVKSFVSKLSGERILMKKVNAT
jgi:hypothetical protein